MPPAEINRERKRGRRWERKRTRARHADELNRGATAKTVAEFRASRFITLAKSEDNLRPTKSRFALSALVLSCSHRDALYVCRLFHFLSLLSPRAFFSCILRFKFLKVTLILHYISDHHFRFVMFLQKQPFSCI